MPKPRVVSPLASPLLSPKWLADNLDNPGIQVIENAWVPDSYLKAHIRGAMAMPCHPHLKRFDADGEKTQYVMPADEFADLCHQLGLRRDMQYVIYDDMHGLFAARFWAVCRYYGVQNISILDGSWHGWLDQGLPVSTRLIAAQPGTDLVPNLRPELFIDQAELQSIHLDPRCQIWDTRRAGEFDGQEETNNERCGHVPGARHLAWTDLLTGEDVEGEPRYLKSPGELADLLTGLGLRQDKTIITYCQSGIRAAFCIFVLQMLGYPDFRLYDASMGEWCNLTDTPLTTDPT